MQACASAGIRITLETYVDDHIGQAFSAKDLPRIKEIRNSLAHELGIVFAPEKDFGFDEPV